MNCTTRRRSPRVATRSFSSPGHSSFGEVDPESGRDEGVSDVYALMGATAGASHELSSEATENVETAREGHTHRSAVRTDGRGERGSPTHRAADGTMTASESTSPEGENDNGAQYTESDLSTARQELLEFKIDEYSDRLLGVHYDLAKGEISTEEAIEEIAKVRDHLSVLTELDVEE